MSQSQRLTEVKDIQEPSVASFNIVMPVDEDRHYDMYIAVYVAYGMWFEQARQRGRVVGNPSHELIDNILEQIDNLKPTQAVLGGIKVTGPIARHEEEDLD